MKECKHNWVEVAWGKRFRAANTFMYHCTRCHQCRIAKLIGADDDTR